MNYHQALRQIKEGQLKPVNLFYGEEAYLQEELVGALVDRALSSAERAMNLHTLDGRETSLSRALELASVSPFGAERRVVVLRHPAFTGAEEGIWQRYLRHPAPRACLVLIIAGKVDRRQAWFTLLEKVGVAVECSPLKEEEMARWITSRVQGSGKAVSPEAAWLIAGAAGGDLRRAAMETDKALAYAGEAPLVGTEEVERVVSRLPEGDIFRLVDAIGRRQREGALVILSRLLRQGEAPAKILFMITRQLRALYAIKFLQEEGLPPGEVKRRSGLSPFLAAKCLGQARNFRLKELEQAWERLLQADLAIKTGQVEAPLALEILILQLC